MTAAPQASTAEELSDAAIIERSRNDPECFAAVFDRYYFQIHGFAAQRLGPSLADDVAAETFLIAFDHRARPQTDAPSHAAYTAAREALVRHAVASAAPARRDRRFLPSRTRILLAASAALAAGAAAVTVVVAGPAGAPAVTSAVSAGPTTVVQRSGRQILLAAATAAAAAPEESGAYWYVKTVYTDTKAEHEAETVSVETWTRRDGRSWVRRSWTGEVEKNDGDHGHWTDGFDLEGTRLSYEQIQALPTDPDDLMAWLTEHATGVLSEEAARYVPMLDVLSRMPAPPEVREAAFRALAALPNVRSLGTADGGESLVVSLSDGQLRLVVDVEAARLRESAFTSAATKPGKNGASLVEKAEWTDDLPETAH
ncbi:CU044_5270 family protein [Streptosporangium sp. NPDC048047]|uniref:CU044_5270 family protein n=1 Tax=Streptosporangium sp. NPDC048047 TaxID=3155748 RepID=UPI00341AF831